MGLNKYFFKAALPAATFKIFSKHESISYEDFFCKNNISGASFDSRMAKEQQIFFALKGNRVDGHDYIEQALKNGVIALVVDQKKKNYLAKVSSELLHGKLIIFVPDTLKALIQLAKYWRQRFSYPVIGITGSVGKTTTKNMLALILKKAGVNAYVSAKNQNTSIGISINIFNMRSHHDVAIFEMGINAVGEMDELADLVRPNIGVITYISNAHNHGLGNIKKVAQEKRKIFKYFSQNNIGVVFGDNEFAASSHYIFPLVTFGFRGKNQISARRIKFIPIKDPNGRIRDFETKFDLNLHFEKVKVQMRGNHKGFVSNALAAASVASLLEIDNQYISEALSSYSSKDGRFEKKLICGSRGTMISDCYNASPESMRAAILAFSKMESDGPKIAVLGDMLELGEKSLFWHRQVGRLLRKALDLDLVLLVGKLSKSIAQTAPVTLKTKSVDDWRAAKTVLQECIKRDAKKDSLILLKGSRGINLDEIVKELS